MSSPSLRTSPALRTVLFGAILAACFPSHASANDELLRKPVGKGAYEMAFSPDQNALWVATSQSNKTDKGGIIYRLDPVTLDVTQQIFNDIKPFGATFNPQTQTLWFTNTVNGMLTVIDAQTGEVKKRIVLDDRLRNETVKPLQPREVVADEKTNTVYVTGVGKESVIWVVDGHTYQLKKTIIGIGSLGTGLALDSAAHRLYSTNGEGELLTIDTRDKQIVSRKKLQNDGKPHRYLNLSLDSATHRAFITDSKQPEVLVVDTRDGHLITTISVPESLGILVNTERHEAYVTHRQAGKVSIIDTTNYQVKKTYDLPTHPNSLALSAEGKTLYVTVKQAASRGKEAAKPDDVVRIALQ